MRSMLTALIVSTLSLAAFGQSTWYVDLNATPPGDGSRASPYVSIQQAIAAPTTVHDDTVIVAAGVYVETLDFGIKAITVRSSAGPLATTLLPADPSAPVVTLGSQHDLGIASLEGFWIRRSAPTQGVGVRMQFGDLGTIGGIRYCIVSGHGVGFENHYDGLIDSCTVTGNGIGVLAASGEAGHHVHSSIVRGNASVDVVPGHPFFSVLSYSNVGDFESAFFNHVGSIDVDPLFWDAAQEDFHLRPGSPCIDTGHPAQLDPDGSRIDMGALPYDPFWAPGTSTSCFGDALACPCGNGGSGEGGCDIPQATGGVALAIVNFAPNGSGGGTAQFAGSGYSPSGQPGSTLIRSPGLEPVPVVFGDGLRCIATSGLLRVGALLASGGTSLHGVSHGAGAGTFHYQVWVRSQPAGFCTAAAFNLSNVVSVTW